MADPAKANGRLDEDGWRPIEEAPCPYGPCLLRLGPGNYATGFCEFEQWQREHDMHPLAPTHFKDFPD